MRRRAGLLAEAVTEGETCLLRYCGRELRLPAAAWPALRFATTAGEFAVEDLPDCLDAEGKLTLVTRLVREGVLQRSPVERFFASCDEREDSGHEPDWEQHLAVIRESRGRGAATE